MLEFHVRIGEKRNRYNDEAKSNAGEYKAGGGTGARKDEPSKPAPALNVHIVLGGQVRTPQGREGGCFRLTRSLWRWD